MTALCRAVKSEGAMDLGLGYRDGWKSGYRQAIARELAREGVDVATLRGTRLIVPLVACVSAVLARSLSATCHVRADR